MPGVETAKGIECKQKALPSPHEAQKANVAISGKRRKRRFPGLLLAAVSGTSVDRTAKKAVLAMSEWHAILACQPLPVVLADSR